MFEIMLPLLEESMQNKKGITFFVNGNTMVGYVTQIIDNTVVEIKNRNSSKAIILISKIDALELS